MRWSLAVNFLLCHPNEQRQRGKGRERDHLVNFPVVETTGMWRGAWGWSGLMMSSLTQTQHTSCISGMCADAGLISWAEN